VEAVLHRERYPSDDEMLAHIETYDRAMVDFYESQGMHDRDPRWSTVMASRTARFHQRGELDGYLQEQGYGWKDGAEGGSD
jgi:hypothetical protein